MVDVKELRVGNVVSVYGKPKILTLQDIRFIDSDNQNPKNKGCNAQYIPLTEEWLLNFGFEKQGIYYFKDYFFGIYDDLSEVCLWNDGEQIGYKNENIKYIHQLQNLYFALTNEELTVNL